MNKEPIIFITKPEKQLKEKDNLEIEINNYDNSHLYYKGFDLGTFKEIANLRQENQKYKEIIDKLKNKTKENIENAKCEITTLTIGDKAYYQYIEKMLDNYVDILKEVE